ncbi:MAG: response regulator [Anaerolineales bacterium]|nr:response regulator [Anaerolineales bacterium]
MNTPYGPLLIVEDVPNILEFLSVTLKFKGYEVQTATNGEEALACIKKARPALVITDILMPKMDGFAFVQNLRTNPDTSDIPVIFLSATYVTPEDKAFAMSLGADRFIEKPVDTEEFLLTIAELLTTSTGTVPPILNEESFYLGYRERLESKLRHKNIQITRTERLLSTLPESQKPAFETMLKDAIKDREEIEAELKQIYQILDTYKSK